MIAQGLPYLVHLPQESSEEARLIAHFEEGKVLFMQERLMKIMQQYGIIVPPAQRHLYQNKSVVYLEGEGNSLFERAFRDIYFELQLPKSEYRWVNYYKQS